MKPSKEQPLAVQQTTSVGSFSSSNENFKKKLTVSTKSLNLYAWQNQLSRHTVYDYQIHPACWNFTYWNKQTKIITKSIILLILNTHSQPISHYCLVESAHTHQLSTLIAAPSIHRHSFWPQSTNKPHTHARTHTHVHTCTHTQRLPNPMMISTHILHHLYNSTQSQRWLRTNCNGKAGQLVQ